MRYKLLMLIFILMLSFMIGFVSAGVDGIIGIDLTPTLPINYSLIPTVNSSDYWDSLDDPSNINVETLSTSLINGSVIFSDGSNLAQDNSNFFWDNVNKRLGIGTSSPGSELEVSGKEGAVFRLRDTYFSAPTYWDFIAAKGSGGWSVKRNGIQVMRIRSNGNLGFGIDPTRDFRLQIEKSGVIDYFGINNIGVGDIMIIKNDGNVGIGTVSPFRKFVVGDGVGDEIMAVFSGNASLGQLAFADISTGTGRYAGAVKYDHSSNLMSLLTSSITQVVIDSSGNVGIGTVSPDAPLHVVGTQGKFIIQDVLTDNTIKHARLFVGHYNNSEKPTMFLWGKSEATNAVMSFGGGSSAGNAVTQVDFYTAANTTTTVGTHRMRIDKFGRIFMNAIVGIGTVSPTHELNVVGDLNVTGTIFTSGLNISNSSFSFMDNENASIKYSVQNKNNGTNATSLITAINNLGNVMGIGIGSSNYFLGSLFMPNITGLYSRSKGDSVFLNFYKQAFIWMFNPSDDNDANNLVEIMRLDETGLNVSGNIISNNSFIPQYIFAHNNATMVLASASVWANLSFDQEVAEIKKGISHVFNDNTNHTFIINQGGIYEINFNFDVIDTSASSTDIDVAGRVVYSNGTEISGSVFETDITKKNIETEIAHTLLVELLKEDVIVFQFVADDVDVQISTHGTFGDHPESATIEIRKVANYRIGS